MTRQWRWQLRKVRAGRCARCGEKRDGVSKWFCSDCLAKRREYARQRLGYQPWQPGRRGRPPADTSSTRGGKINSPRRDA